MKILVVVPTYNRTEFLNETIESLVSQTRKPDHTIVIGNVAPATPGDYTFIPSTDVLPTKLNTAVSLTDCDAFLILCDDDKLLPEYIERTVAKMEETEADIVYTEFNNEPVTSLVRKTIWEKVGGFAAVPFYDWDFYWSCREAGGSSIPLREHLFEYRTHPAQQAQHQQWKDSGQWAEWEALILERHPKRGQP